MPSNPRAPKPMLVFVRNEPTKAQRDAGNYAKAKLSWRGMVISIENPAGSVRRGVDGSGQPWETRMLYDYGYLLGTEGVDGDHVDCFVGPNLDAPIVYVVHARKFGDWSAYDEDKCMIGFDSEEDARLAFLHSYNDPRFLGPVTAMPVEEFKAKVMATKERPAMVKSVVLIKSAPESKSSLIKEHKRLVAVLRSPSHEDDLEEADKQEEELEEYMGKAITRGRADSALTYRLRMIDAQLGPLAVAANHDSESRARYEALVQERYTIMVALGEASI